MNFFKKLGEKPWLTQTNSGGDFYPFEVTDYFPAKTALKFFIAVISLFFLLFTITFISRSQYADFQALAGEPWLPFYQPVQLWVNTFLLVLASFSLHSASYFIDEKNAYSQEKMETNALFIKRSKYLIISLALSVIFSLAFVIGQVNVWLKLNALGFSINSNPANSYFYILTALHAIHLLGGLLALFRVVHLYKEKTRLDSLKKNLKLCAWYWHFLLMLWGFLFLLFTASPSTYKTIAAMCGL